ncbi:phage antirepressor N-terminal domain-containing protein [Thiocystis violacea]|uniref:phage antirepressor N-terminal domain-containing protein n=1 Tax=Thiocystis violacea TaxID=13725 RepID=UPI0019087B71|nr:phage antirepressor N-terminal domain-containing protein [Thiocystis violacea]MBK1723840.1 hypothetical protein [Thiocystis violacea]
MSGPTIHLCAISFRDTTLYVLDYDGKPYTPIRPIAEGMGLTWQAQHKKLMANQQRFRVTNIVMQMPGDDQRRKVCCIPLNKLSGWLMSINAKKVKPALRAMITAYQEECDEVLWEHWSQQLPKAHHDAYDNYSLACACFEELAALFYAIAGLTQHEARALAGLGHERADDWRDYYRRNSEALLLR